MINMFKRLWNDEPARLISIVTGAIVVVVGELGDAAPLWATLAVAALVYVSGELTRSQVSPAR